jgi:hypothetical protein
MPQNLDADALAALRGGLSGDVHAPKDVFHLHHPIRPPAAV